MITTLVLESSLEGETGEKVSLHNNDKMTHYRLQLGELNEDVVTKKQGSNVSEWRVRRDYRLFFCLLQKFKGPVVKPGHIHVKLTYVI